MRVVNVMTVMDSFVADPIGWDATQRLERSPHLKAAPAPGAVATAVVATAQEATTVLCHVIRGRVHELLSATPDLAERLCEWLPPPLPHPVLHVQDRVGVRQPALPGLPRPPKRSATEDRFLRRCLDGQALSDHLARHLCSQPAVTLQGDTRRVVELAATSVADEVGDELADMMRSTWDDLQYKYEIRAADRVRRSLGCAQVQLVPASAA